MGFIYGLEDAVRKRQQELTFIILFFIWVAKEKNYLTSEL